MSLSPKDIQPSINCYGIVRRADAGCCSFFDRSSFSFFPLLLRSGRYLSDEDVINAAKVIIASVDLFRDEG